MGQDFLRSRRFEQNSITGVYLLSRFCIWVLWSVTCESFVLLKATCIPYMLRLLSLLFFLERDVPLAAGTYTELLSDAPE